MKTPTRSDAATDEHELVVRAQEGDRNAFGELVRRHQRRVWLVCRQYLPPDAADGAAQSSFIKAYTGLAGFDGRAAFSTWLTRIAINTCLDTLRRQRRRGAVASASAEEPDGQSLAQLPDPAEDPESRAIKRQAVARLAALEALLPERQRQIFRLRFYAELELEEIATGLGVHVGTVKTQLHRAVHRLRREMGELR